jgi:tetratricopeptide (TPR) repeat protein
MKHQLLLFLSLIVANSLFAQKEDIFYYDGFTNNKHNWNVSSDANSGAQIKDGSLFFESKKKNASWFKYNPSTPSIDATKDFTVEWSFQQIAGSEDWGTGLVCFLDDNGTNAFGLWILSNGQWTITKTGDPAFGWKSSPAVLPGNNVMNTASITKKGGSISFVINNQQVHQISYSPGLIKHVAFQIGSEKIIAVDYLKMAYLKSDNSKILTSVDYTFEKFYDEGAMFYKKKDYEQAIIALTEAINTKPNEAAPYNFRGYAYRFKNEIDIAISDYLEAIRLSPSYHNAYSGLGYAYLNKNEYDKALNAFSKAISLSPKEINYYSAKGSVFQSKKEYDSAIIYYNQIIRLDPRNILGYRNRANVYIVKKDYERAITEYNQFLRIDSLNASAYGSRASIHRTIKNYEASINDYTNALRLSPKNLVGYSLRGHVYKLMGETQKAINDLNEYVKLSGKSTAYSSRARLYADLKKYELALADYNKALEIDPKDITARINRIIFYENTKQYDLAVTEVETVLGIEPKNAYVHYLKAVLLKDQGNYQLAIKSAEKSVELDTESFSGYVGIISPLLRLGDIEKASQYAKKAISNGSNKWGEDYNFYILYVEVIAKYLGSGQYELALNGLDESLKEYNNSTLDKDVTSSEYIDILSLKGYVLEKLNRLKEAKEVYEQSLAINPKQQELVLAINGINKNTTVIASTDKTAPEIQLISPQPSRGLQIVSGNQNTEVIGKAKDPSGIASVTINGKPVTKIEEDGLFVSSLNLKSGLNSINITATDKKGNVSTKSFQLTGNMVAKKEETDIIIPVANTETAPQFHALLIAANDYVDPKIADLENPVKDATELKNILQTNYTFAPKNIETLYNKSREEIMQALVVKSNAMGENDNLLIFYAGHGIAEKDKFGDVDGYWVPSSAKKGLNASYISADDINKALKRSNAKHILVVADACFSGAFTRSLSSDASIGVQKQYSVPSRKIMASGNLEPVPDNSKFVYYLKKNLKENKEKYLTAKKLFDSFYEAILNNSETSPQYAAIKNVGDEGGEFVFVKK